VYTTVNAVAHNLVYDAATTGLTLCNPREHINLGASSGIEKWQLSINSQSADQEWMIPLGVMSSLGSVLRVNISTPTPWV